VQKQNISVFATEAMRTAKNKDEMLKSAKEASGLTVDILSPGMESLFGAMGARSGFDHVDGLFMDLGGGSVQMTYVDSTTNLNYDILAAEAAKSMPFGAAKLSAALTSQDKGDAAKKELRTSMKDTFHGLTKRFPKLREQVEHEDGITIYFCGGGFRGYGSMLMHTEEIKPYPIPSIGGYTVPGERFIRWKEMLYMNKTEDGKIFGMSKRRREQFPAIVTVVHALVEAVPKIKKVIFCSGGNREGVLYMKLPTKVREANPFTLLQEPVPGTGPESVVASLSSALTPGYPSIISPHILHFVACSTWQEMGDPDIVSAKALRNPISGVLAGLPGMTHEQRAILGLIMCARWGSDLGLADKQLADNLQALIGHELSWWCRYIGALARLLATVIPIFPTKETIEESISFIASASHGLGKKGHKVGIRLKIKLKQTLAEGLSVGELEGMFEKVGKGLKVDWKAEAEVVHA
jgi:retrograde regulation protein 2